MHVDLIASTVLVCWNVNGPSTDSINSSWRVLSSTSKCMRLWWRGPSKPPLATVKTFEVWRREHLGTIKSHWGNDYDLELILWIRKQLCLSVMLSRLNYYIDFNEIWLRDTLILEKGHMLLFAVTTNKHTGGLACEI